MKRILIVDDEKPARSKTRRFITKAHPNAEILEAADGASAVDTIRGQKPDLVLLDIQMPGLTGFDVIRQVGPDRMPPVIFVTAYDRYAVQAFEVQAVDYLLKPFDFDRLKTALDRAMATSEQTGEIQSTLTRLLQRLEDHTDYQQKLAVKADERIFFVETDDIHRIEAQGKYAIIHTADAGHMMRTSLQQLETKLDPQRFYRIHRSHMVNIDYISELQAWFHGDYNVVLRDGTTLRMSRRYSARLLDRF